MAVVFLKIGQDVHIEGMNLEDAVNEGIRQGYVEGYLRKSVVGDPLLRKNTEDNTPGIIHYEIVPGENIEITVAPKGFGSENMSRVYMLKPADGIDEAWWLRLLPYRHVPLASCYSRLLDARRISSCLQPMRSTISSSTSSGIAEGISILLMTGIISRSCSIAI